MVRDMILFSTCTVPPHSTGPGCEGCCCNLGLETVSGLWISINWEHGCVLQTSLPCWSAGSNDMMLSAEVTSQGRTVLAFLYPGLALTFPFWPLAAPPIWLLPPTFCRCASFPSLNFSWNQQCLLQFQIRAAKLLVAGNCHVILNPGGWNETSQVLLTQ